MTTTSAQRGTETIKIPTALHIPVAVLAQMPEKLRLLGSAIKVTSATINGSRDDFRHAHDKVRSAYNDANGTANCIVNAIEQLNTSDCQEMEGVVKAANAARNLTSALYKVSGNIHNDDCFKTTFNDLATVEATVAALGECGDEIRATVRKFGY